MMAEDPEHIFFHPEFGQLHTTDLQHCLDIDPSFDTLLFSANEEIKRLFSPYCNSNSISQGHHHLNTVRKVSTLTCSKDSALFLVFYILAWWEQT